MSETKKETKKQEPHVIHEASKERILPVKMEERNQTVTKLIEESENDIVFIDTSHVGVDVPVGDIIIDVRPTAGKMVYVVNLTLPVKASDVTKYLMIKKAYAVLKKENSKLKNPTVVYFDDAKSDPNTIGIIINDIFTYSYVIVEKLQRVDQMFNMEFKPEKKDKKKKKKDKKKKGKK